LSLEGIFWRFNSRVAHLEDVVHDISRPHVKLVQLRSGARDASPVLLNLKS